MRNDARPIGGDSSHQSPVAQDQSEVVNRESGIQRTLPQSRVETENPTFDADDPVMPTNDSTLNTKI